MAGVEGVSGNNQNLSIVNIDLINMKNVNHSHEYSSSNNFKSDRNGSLLSLAEKSIVNEVGSQSKTMEEKLVKEKDILQNQKRKVIDVDSNIQDEISNVFQNTHTIIAQNSDYDISHSSNGIKNLDNSSSLKATSEKVTVGSEPSLNDQLNNSPKRKISMKPAMKRRKEEYNNCSSTEISALAGVSNVEKDMLQRIEIDINNQSSVQSCESRRKLNREKIPECDPSFASRVLMKPIPFVAPLPKLNAREMAELELSLQIGEKFEGDNTWKDDWTGNLQLIDKDLIMNRNYLAQNPNEKKITLPFCEWVAKQARTADDFDGVRLLFSHVYHMKGTPEMAKRIMAYYLQLQGKTVVQRFQDLMEAIRRISYDPSVLMEDGWTTVKADNPDSELGGAFLIGRKVIWHRYEAIIIAFVRDDEIGDLWKAMWFEDKDTFDLEADEIQEGMQRWERKQAAKRRKTHANAGTIPTCNNPKFKRPSNPFSSSSRFDASKKISVDGIGESIILARSYKSKVNIPWPARVMHVTEVKALRSQNTSRRSSSRNEIHVVFLAPFWNGLHYQNTSRNNVQAKKTVNEEDINMYSSGPLFEVETIDVSKDTIQKYPHDGKDSFISIDQLRAEFTFLKLPDRAFPRYLDSHRLALSLKVFARKRICNATDIISDDTSHAGTCALLTDTHALSVQTALFPVAVLNLPFEYILSNLPDPIKQISQLVGDDREDVTDPIMQLDYMLKSLRPPHCWGSNTRDENEENSTMSGNRHKVDDTISNDISLTALKSPIPVIIDSNSKNKINEDNDMYWDLKNFASDYLLKNIGYYDTETSLTVFHTLKNRLENLLSQLRSLIVSINELSSKQMIKSLRFFLGCCIQEKGHGEDVLYNNQQVTTLLKGFNFKMIVREWHKACERIYKQASIKMTTSGSGNGVTVVITDSRCNEHLTSSGSFERAVRIPAAIRGAKKAGAGSLVDVPLITKVENHYMKLAEQKVIPKAHKSTYLKRMKDKVSSIRPDAKGVPLTDDSEGEGGEDTMGSRNSYTAAVVGVAAALKGVDMIVGGECVNGFCAVRPPGHHAGRELRPMKAVSNGFCLLNAAACAALYATSPKSEGGLGLRRVCVIDIDVHHGNGTQDILCSTQDSRFLYVSTHAGGAHINGYDDEDHENGLHRNLNTYKNEGIFPGRCGDSSPHEGVLNIPLGQKISSQAIGTSLVSRVSPAVQAFSPELIIISAGFDAHKNDPLGMGGLSAEDFGSVTSVICHMAHKICSGRVLSILEGGYGVPCCRKPMRDLFLPNNTEPEFEPMKILDLGDDLPDTMDDHIDPILAQKLDRCHQEGFLECVKEHVGSLAKNND